MDQHTTRLLTRVLGQSLGRRRRRSAGASMAGLIVILVVVLMNNRGGSPSSPAPPPGGAIAGNPSRAAAGTQAILDAYRDKRSGLLVQASGVVKKHLPDDDDGDRHQRMLVTLAGGHTVLIAHNIDLAPRVPAREGDALEFKGDYEWNDEGGVIHWTHHDPNPDPARRREGGWLKHLGRTYE